MGLEKQIRFDLEPVEICSVVRPKRKHLPKSPEDALKRGKARLHRKPYTQIRPSPKDSSLEEWTK